MREVRIQLRLIDGVDEIDAGGEMGCSEGRFGEIEFVAVVRSGGFGASGVVVGFGKVHEVSRGRDC